MDPETLGLELSTFNELSQTAKEQLEQCMATVDEGKAPLPHEFTALNEAIGALQAQYDRIADTAKKYIAPDKLPSDRVSVDVYAKLAEEGRKRAVLEEIDEAQAVLRQFLRIKSRLEKYIPQLTGLQDEARQLLAALEEPDPDAGKLTEVEGPRLFVDAVTADDGARNANLILHELEPYYSADVRIGFFEQAYYLPEDAKEKKKRSSKREKSPEVRPASEAKPFPEAEAASKAKPAPRTKAESKTASASKPEPKPKAKADAAAKTKAKAKTKSEPPAKTKDKAKAETAAARSREKEKLVVVNRGKGVKSGSANQFKKELRQLSTSERLATGVLSALSGLAVASAPEIRTYLRLKQDGDPQLSDLNAALALLTKKGLLTEYEEEGAEERLYRLAPYTAASMGVKMVKDPKNNLWTLSYESDRLEELSRDIPDDVLEHDRDQTRALMEYLKGVEEMTSREEARRILDHTEWNEDAYVTRVPYEGEQVEARLILHKDRASAKGKGNVLFYTENKDARFQRVDAELVFRYVPGVLAIRGQGKRDNRWMPLDLSEAKEKSPAKRPPKDAKEQGASQPASSRTRQTSTPRESEEGASEPSSGIRRPDGSESSGVAPEEEPKDHHQRELSEFLESLESAPQPEDEMFVRVCEGLLSFPGGNPESLVTQALVLAQSAALIPENALSRLFSERLQLASNLGFTRPDYSVANLVRLFGDDKSGPLALCAYSFALLAPTQPHDYVLHSMAADLMKNYETLFPGYEAFRPLFASLVKAQEQTDAGFSGAVVARLGNESKSARAIGELQKKARQFLEPIPPKNRIKKLPELYRHEFGPGSRLHEAMEIIIADDRARAGYVEEVLSEFGDAQGEKYFLNKEKVDDEIDVAWTDLLGRSFRLQYTSREHCFHGFEGRLELMFDWLTQTRMTQIGQEQVKALVELRKEILREILRLQENAEWKSEPDSNLLAWALERMTDRLTKTDKPKPFQDMLLTGRFSVADSGVPLLDGDLNDVLYFEPWRNAGRHAADLRAGAPAPAAVAAEIRDDEFVAGPLMDNLNQLRMLSLSGRVPEEEIDQERVEQAEKFANDSLRDFERYLGLAQAKGTIRQKDRERLTDTARLFQERFYARADYAVWRRFLLALRKQAEDAGRRRASLMLPEYEKLPEQSRQTPLYAEGVRLLKEDLNLTLAEDSLLRLKRGESEPLEPPRLDPDHFADFTSKETFSPLFSACRRNENTKRQSLRRFGAEYVNASAEAFEDPAAAKSAKELLSSWPSNRETTSAAHIQSFLTHLGFSASKPVQAVRKPGEDVYRVSVSPDEAAGVLPHPVAVLGSRLPAGLLVPVVAAHLNPQQLLNTISGMKLQGPLLILLDHHWDIGQRRQFAELAHAYPEPVFLVDQVLALYLATRPKEERLRALAQCSLPYARYQPFFPEDAPAEMTLGRIKLRELILDSDGSSLVLGPPGTGKTSLLRAAALLTSNPVEREFSVLADAEKKTSEADVVKAILQKLNPVLPKAQQIRNIKTVENLRARLQALLDQGQIRKLTLFVDQLDAFEAANEDGFFEILSPLVSLRENNPEQFRFACALRRDPGDPPPFWGCSLEMGPLGPRNASRLLAEPLEYLGVRSGMYPQLDTLAAYANRYPKLLQTAGEALAEATFSPKVYARNFSASEACPPFPLKEDFTERALTEHKLLERVMKGLSAMLESDPRYLWLARCVAYMHYFEDNDVEIIRTDISLKQIQEVAESFSVTALTSLSEEELETLALDLSKAGLLASLSPGRYRLARSSMLDLLGEDSAALEAALDAAV